MILPDPLATRIPVPELIAAAVGAAPVVPIKICPAVSVCHAGTPEPLVTRPALIPVARPETALVELA